MFQINILLFEGGNTGILLKNLINFSFFISYYDL